MVNRIGGLASGMDIDALVAKLMQAEKSPLIKLQQKKTMYEWQRDAYRGINTKLQTFDKYIADNLILKSMKSKTAAVSNSTYASATATPSASGTLALEGVSQLASAARGLGDQINATANTKLSELGISNGVIKLNAIKPDGTMPTEGTDIVIDESMTISKFVEKINDSNAGVSALFENGRLSITAKNTGDNKNGAEVQVTAGADIFGKLGYTSLNGKTSGDLASGGKNAMFQVNGIATERSSNTFTISGYNVTLKETFNAGGTINSLLTLSFNERKNAATDLSAKESTFDTKKQAHADATDVYNLAKASLSSSLNDAQKVLYSELALETRPLLAELNYNQVTKLAEIDFTDEEAARTAIANLTEADGFPPALKDALGKIEFGDLKEISELTEADFNAISDVEKLEKTFNVLNKQVLKDLSGLGADIATALTGRDLSVEDPFADLPEGPLKEKLKSLDKGTLEALQSLSGPEIENLSVVADAQIKLTTAKTEMDQADSAYKAAITRNANAEANYKQLYKENIYKESDGDFEAAYLNHVATATAPPQITADPSTVSPVTITSTTNVDEMMNKIKEFVTTYNGLIKDLSEQTKETKYRSFAPLTDEQRKDMSENEIKLWEEKAKSGLLRSDTILRSGLAGMRALVYEANPAVSNQKFNTLFNVGITTTKNYNDGGQLEIDEKKLQKALEEDPDAVAALFSNLDGKQKDTITVTDKDGNISTKEADTRGYLQKLRSTMDSFKIDIEKKAGRTSATEQTYSIGKNIVDTNKRIDTWQEKLKNIEARYWKQFSAMEQAINKANSQSSMFMQGLGA
ncbi:flagellar hook-associated protein 2 [Lysinibacillus parviboronicapiens]|uniref:Flagellar hook-associated protein 2 n=1 Tax=Lysinibacillus parviboronicapiens TaxID=436516 RepID=A0ABV2PIE8_9BACI